MPDIYFSDVFGVDPHVLDEYGAFNVSLIADLPIFIDPFLLFNSEKEQYQELHESLIRYMRFLKAATRKGPIDRGLIEAWFSFREVRQNWFGFTATSNRGHGLGRSFARALHDNFASIFYDFGEESVTRSSHIEKLCLIRKGVGRDNISDFTTNLIQWWLASYTQTLARQCVPQEYRRTFSIRKSRFNYKTQSWTAESFDLPAYGSDYVLLTPKDMLTRDEVWINRSDLISRFDQIAQAMPNAALRAQLNKYLHDRLSRIAEPTKKQENAIYGDAIDRHPEVLDYYIRQKEDEGELAVAVSAERVRETHQRFVVRVKELAEQMLEPAGFYDLDSNTFEEARRRLLFLKDVIENKGGHRIFYVDGRPIRREEDLQIMYRLVWYASPSVVSREVNDGRGPVDFLAARGPTDKVLVELKLASNTRLEQNLQKQCRIYEGASDPTHPSIKGVVFFTDSQQDRVRKILRALDLENRPEVVLIDARADNKPSGSKA